MTWFSIAISVFLRDDGVAVAPFRGEPRTSDSIPDGSREDRSAKRPIPRDTTPFRCITTRVSSQATSARGDTDR